VKLVKIQTVDSITSRVDCSRPKTIRSLVLIKHGSCGFNESSIFSSLLSHFVVECM
jgi:hypothetical protein